MVLARSQVKRSRITSGDVQAFQLTTAAASGWKAFQIGLGFKKGDAPVDVNTSLGSDAQVKVLRRYGDSSIRHVAVSGLALLTQDVPLTVTVSRGAPGGGVDLTAADIQSAAPTGSIQCGSFGTVTLASLLSSAPFLVWVAGPRMIDAIYRAEVGGGTLLSAWYHVRLFSDGRIRVRPIAENGYLDNGAGAVAANADRSYVPTMSVGGVTVYNNGGSSLSHYANTRYCAEAWIGGDPQVTPKHDVAYLKASKLLPNYFSGTPSDATLDALTQSYTQMGHGDLTADMGNVGAQDQIGLLPKWNALYALNGDPRPYRATIVHAQFLNSYGICWRDFTTKLPVKPSAFPTWSLSGPGGGGTNDVVRGSLRWEISHMPAEAYMAYLLTGDYFHYETLLSHVALGYLAQGNGGLRGNGTSRIVFAETRGNAWALRNLSQLASIYPAGDAVAAEYQTQLASNYTFWKNFITSTLGITPIGYIYEGNLNVTAPGWNAPWEDHFWMGANGYGADLEPLSDMTDFNYVRDWMSKGVVGILGPNGAGNYCFTKASQYSIKIAPSEDYDQTHWYQTWGQVFTATWGVDNTACANTLEGGSGGAPDLPDGYWGNLMPAIAYAVDHGASGAQAAWDRLTGATNWSTLRNSGFNNVPQWGIGPRNWSG